MLARKSTALLLLVVLAMAAPSGHGSGEQFQCGEPKRPFDPHVQTVPAGQKFPGPVGSHSDDWSWGDARAAAEEEIGNTHDAFSCAACSGSGCEKDVSVHPEDAEWEYDWYTCVGIGDCNETHVVVTQATLNEGGFYLRRCTECE